FFFQAEDGIRDATVTGVQTCALPIYWNQEHSLARDNHPVNTHHMRELRPARHTTPLRLVYWRLKESTEFRRIPPREIRIKPVDKIGRASCREREGIQRLERYREAR